MARYYISSLLVGFLRRTWLVALATVVVCSVITARTVAALSAPEPVRAGGAPLTSPARPSPPPRVVPDGAQLVARNMFCSTCDAVGAPLPLPGAPVRAIDAQLISTTIAPDAIATVRVPSTEVQGSWAIGERIPGVGTITRIGAASIDVVDGAGQTATLSLRTAVGREEGGAATPAPAPDASPFAGRVSKVDDHTYEVERALVRELVTGATKPGQARIVPVVKEGVVKGVRLLGVTASTAPAAIGLHNGDLLDAIDGQPIKTAQQMLDLYASLDQLSTVTLQGTRAGKPLAVTLRLR